MGCGCRERSGDPLYAVGACEVCRLVDGDDSPKVVRWCDFCRAWICDGCWGDWKRRTRAAIRRRIGRFVDASVSE